jgi:hypothetical protein
MEPVEETAAPGGRASSPILLNKIAAGSLPY